LANELSAELDRLRIEEDRLEQLRLQKEDEERKQLKMAESMGFLVNKLQSIFKRREVLYLSEWFEKE